MQRGDARLGGHTFIIISAALVVGLFAGPAPQEGPVPPAPGGVDLTAPQRPSLADCPNLDSRLVQLLQASDPDAFAMSARLDNGPSGVLVIAELVGDDEPDATVYGLTDVARSVNFLQARVPLAQLCPLAADPAVSLVRPPAARTPLAALPSTSVRNPPEKAPST